jgi:hypothetical protein
MYFITRWFALDTVLGVVSVQVLCGVLTGRFLFKECLGVCCLVSMAYMCDRYRDIVLKDKNVARSGVFQHRLWLLLCSVLGLGGGALVCLYGVTLGVKMSFIVCGVLFFMHTACLRWEWYLVLKDVSVSTIFTLGVLCVYMDSIANSVIVLVGFYVYFNLISHVVIEGVGNALWRKWWPVIFVVLGTVVLSLAHIALAWVGVGVFLSGLLLHVLLVCIKPYYWYELGELAFAWPFIVLSFILR